jgi:hypothetical protein
MAVAQKETTWQSKGVLAIKYNNEGVAGATAIAIANHRSSTILSNRELDRRLVLTDVWRNEADNYPAWSGTLLAYPGKSGVFGRTVETRDRAAKIRLAMDIPPEFVGEKGIALAVNHGYTFKGDATPVPTIIPHRDGQTVFFEVVGKQPFKAILDFPQKSGFFGVEPDFFMPCGKEVPPVDITISGLDRSSKVRYLLRKEGASVGLVARSFGRFARYGEHGQGMLAIIADEPFSQNFGFMALTRAPNAPVETTPELVERIRHASDLTRDEVDALVRKGKISPKLAELFDFTKRV